MCVLNILRNYVCTHIISPSFMYTHTLCALCAIHAIYMCSTKHTLLQLYVLYYGHILTLKYIPLLCIHILHISHTLLYIHYTYTPYIDWLGALCGGVHHERAPRSLEVRVLVDELPQLPGIYVYNVGLTELWALH